MVLGRQTIFLVAVALLAAACGDVSERGSSSSERVPMAAGPKPHGEEPAPEQGVASVGSVAFARAGDERPAHELYSVFSRPRNDADRRATSVAADSGFFERDERSSRHFGDLSEKNGRLLLDGLGGDKDMLYAAPTTKGEVCFGLLPNGGRGCGSPGPDGIHLSWSFAQGSLVVYGLVADAVASVEIVLDGSAHPARTGQNAFALRVDETDPDALDAAVFRRRDGTIERVDLDRFTGTPMTDRHDS